MAVRGRDAIVAIKPCGRGLLLETLRYADEIRASDRIFADIEDQEIAPDMLALARELIGRKTSPFKPEAFRSHYAEALRELIETRRRSGTITAPREDAASDRSNVVDLMEALKKSLATGKSEGPGKPTRQPSPAKGKGRSPRKRASG